VPERRKFASEIRSSDILIPSPPAASNALIVAVSGYGQAEDRQRSRAA